MRTAGDGVEVSQTKDQSGKHGARWGGHLGDSLAAVTGVRRQRAGEQSRNLNGSRDMGAPWAWSSAGRTR